MADFVVDLDKIAKVSRWIKSTFHDPDFSVFKAEERIVTRRKLRQSHNPTKDWDRSRTKGE